MESLQKILVNKENQFREMSAQLLAHLNTINRHTETVKNLTESKASLENQLSVKEIAFQSLLKQKEELFLVLQALESPELQADLAEKPIPTMQSPPEPPVAPDLPGTPEVQEEEKEEAYISDEIDITLELQKLGLVDLIKKY